jgi:hypothetical protein
VDGETLTLDILLRLGVRDDLDVGLRLPLLWRGGGRLDSFIDSWHRLFGLPDADRPLFLGNAFRLQAQTPEGEAISWEAPGAGLGDIELEARRRVHAAGPDAASAAVVLRLSLPTASGPFAGSGPGLAAQLVGAAPLARRLDVHAGAGATVQGATTRERLEYASVRGHAFLALEWRPGGWLSLVAETNVASRLVENVDRYPGLHWTVNLCARADLGRLRLDLGLTENIADQQSTTDLAFVVGLTVRP